MSTLIRDTNNLKQFHKHLSVLIKPTDACNLRCKYCFEQHNGYHVNQLLLEDLRKFCNITFPHYNSIYIVWHGGEPTFLGKDILEDYTNIIKHYAKKYNTTIDFSMQSNGTLINEEFVQFLKENKIHIGISFDGVHNDNTRNSTDMFFQTKKLLDQYKIGFGVITVVSGLNYRELIDNYEYMKKHKIHLKLAHYENINAPDNNLILPLDGYIKKMKEFFDYWINDSECNIKVDPFLRMINDYYNGYSGICARSSCMRGWLCLEPNGDITPCDRTFPKEYIYGNVAYLKDIREIYKSQPFLSLMKGANIRRMKCKQECDLYNFCEGGCNHNAIHENGLENNKGFSCKAFYEIFSYVIKQSKLYGMFENYIDFSKIKNPTVIKLLQSIKKNNVKGDLGVINKSGKIGDSAFLINPKEKTFWDNIEQGVKSTVKILLNEGLKPYSSCQGHDRVYANRYVAVTMEREEVKGLKNFIYNLNQRKKYNRPILYGLVETPSEKFIYKNEFINPVIVEIIFGLYNNKETLKKQKDFEQHLNATTLKNTGLDCPDIYKVDGFHTDVHV